MLKQKLKLGFIGGGLNSAIGRVHWSATAIDSLFEVTCGIFSRNKDVNRKTAEYEFKEPLNYYATSKYLFDRYVETQAPVSRVQGFRYFNVYGPHEEHKKDQASPISKFFHEATWKHEIDIFEGSENFKRDFVFVGDICELHYRMLDVNESGIWNAGTGVATSFEEIAIMIAEKYESNVNRIPMPEELKHQYQEYTCANLHKLNSTVKMNWFPVEDYINYEL